MKTIRRTLALLLTACMLLCFMPAAFAEGPEFSDVSTVAAYIRDAMIARETELVFVLNVPAQEIGEITGDNLKSYMADRWEEIKAALFIHTGAPNGGDYLRWHADHYGYQMKVSYSSQSTSIAYQLTVDAAYYTDPAQEQAVADRLDTVMAQLDLTGKSDYEKVKTITDFICDTVTYDYANLNDDTYTLKYSAYAALINGTSVCQGYANLFYRMALLAGLDCRIIIGNADNGEATEAHAWNIVKLGGKYYWIDPTWIDGTGSDAYFLQGKNGFGDHYPDAEFTAAAFQAAYPIADTAYDPSGAEQPCDHVWDAGTEIAPASCTEDGETLFTCTLCGATKTEPIPAPGHSYGAPTYEWGEGYLTCTAKAVCANDPSHVIEETVKAHVETTDPTCTEDGKIVYSVVFSSRRFYAQTKEVPIPAPGHDLVDHEGKAPTCTEPGWSAYQTCTRCDYSNYVALEPTDHSYGEPVYEWSDDLLTCTAKVICANDATHVIEETVKAHVETTDPTCTEDGKTVYTAAFNNKRFYGQVKEVVIPAPGHDLVNHDGKAATCTEAGWKAYQTCTRCDYSTYAEIAALGHEYSEWTVTQKPTCTEAGQESRLCARCLNVDTRKAAALGHDFGEWQTVTPATPEAEGVEQRLCSRCLAAETRAIPKLPAPAYLLGDVDGDGKIGTGDARKALRIAIGLEPTLTHETTAYQAADIDLDGVVGTGDARLILRRAIGIIDADRWGVRK